MVSFLSNSKKITTNILNQLRNPEPKSELLPYEYYDEENKIFINNDSIGFVLKMMPIVGSNKKLLEQLSLFFDQDLPLNSYLQFLLIGNPKIDEIVDNWLVHYNNADEILKKLASKRAEYLKSLTETKDSNYILKDYSLYVIFSKEDKYSKSLINSICNFRARLEGCIEGTKQVDVQEFLELTTDFISPKKSASNYNKYDLLSKQISKGNPFLVSDNKIIHSNSYKSKCYEFEKTPKDFSVSEMISLLGDSSRDNLQIPGRLILSYIISSNISSKKQSLLKDKGMSLIKNLDSFLVKFDSRLKDEGSEWVEIEKLLAGGKRLLTTSFNIILTTRKENWDKAEQALLSLYITNQFKLKSLDYFMLPSFLSALPFGISSGIYDLIKKFNLTKTTISSEPLCFLPIHGEWKGNSDFGILTAGRRGQVAPWNPFLGESNYNVALVGDSGSGKSVLLQDLAANLLATGTKVFVLDIGRSYEKLCSLLSGEFIEFNTESDICINPFTHANIRNAREKEEFLGLILPIIAKMAAPKRGTTDIEDALIAQILKEVWDKRGREATITDIANKLYNMNSSVGKDLATMLFQYSDKGAYGRFFQGEANISFKNKFTVIEFEELRERRDLLAVIMQMLSMQILTQIFMGDRGKKFAIIFDEAWFCLENFPNYLAELSRTMRKYGCSLILGTQAVTDFFTSDATKVVFANCPWKIMLKQNMSKFTNSIDSSDKIFNENTIGLINSLNVIPDKYSEMLIMSSQGSVVKRLILDPFSRILYSTSPEIFSEIQNLKKQGLTVIEAVELVARKKYGAF